MQIKKGHNRFVFVFSSRKFVIKLPIISFYRSCRSLIEYIKRGSWKSFQHEFEYGVGTYHSLKYYILRGVYANWAEFRIYRKTRSPFLQPTYFSLFGFLNIQRCDEPCELDCISLWVQLHRLTNGYVFEDSHHFDNPNNFSFHNGKLRMHDYGSAGSQRVIERYGVKIFELFDPAFNFEEEKKRKKEVNP